MRVRAMTWAVCCVLLACGADDEGEGGGYNGLCNANADCTEGLICAGAGALGKGMCTSACSSDGECSVHGGNSVCVGAGVGAGVCYDRCMDSVQCPRTHNCTMTVTESFSTCRPSLNN